MNVEAHKMIITYFFSSYGFSNLLEKKTDFIHFRGDGKATFTDENGYNVTIDADDILSIETEAK